MRTATRTMLPFLLLLGSQAFAQSEPPPCEPLSHRQSSISCWQAKAVQLFKAKKLEEATTLLQKMEDYTAGQPLLEAHRLQMLGNVYFDKIQWDSSYRCTEAAAKIFLEENHPAGASVAYKTMGAVLMKKMELDKAMPLLYKSIEMAERAGKDSLKIVPYMNLSFVFGQLGDTKKWLEHIRMSYALAKKWRDQKLTSITGMSIAMHYIDNSMLDSAKIFADEILSDTGGSRQLKACGYYSLALWETARGNWERAEQCYQKIKNDESLSPYFRIGFLHGYATFLKERKMFGKAKAVFEEVVKQAKLSKQIDLMHAAVREFHPMLEEMQDYRLAYQVAKEHILLNDSTYNIQLEEKVRDINVKYETAEKERALQTSKLKLAEQTNQRNLFLGGSVLIFLAGGIAFVRQRFRIKLAEKQREQEAALAKQKIEHLQQEQNYLAFKSMVAGEEAERNRLAKELHDGLGGTLSNLKLTLSNRHPSANRQDLQEAVKIVDKASTELRRIARNLMPEALVKFGLIAALEDLCSELETHAHLQMDFQTYGVREPLPENMILPLYRIVQEALNNVVKHSQADEVMLQLIQQDGTLHLTIEDNGIGFQWDDTSKNGGSGLKNLQSRVAFLNGHIEFDSQPGAGTSINIDIPLP